MPENTTTDNRTTNPSMLSITLRDVFAIVHFSLYGNVGIAYAEADKFLEARKK